MQPVGTSNHHSRPRMRHPLELYEILDSISWFLQTPDLLQAILVSRTWHSIFIRPLWLCIELQDDGCAIASKDSFDKHAHLIRQLEMNTRIQSWHFDCPGLVHVESLVLHAVDEFPARTKDKEEKVARLQKGVIQLVQKNPKLKEVEVCFNLQPPGEAFWSAVASLTRLDALVMSGMSRQPSPTGKGFWRACAQARVLQLSGVCVQDEDIESIVRWNQVEELRLWQITGVQHLDLFKVMTSMTGLRVLSVFIGGFMEITGGEAIAKEAASGTWPALHSLILEGKTFTDVSLSKLLNGMSPACCLMMTHSALGPRTMESLGRHFGTLERINLTKARAGPPNAAQVLLSSCPKLTSIITDSISSADVLNGAPWVCLGLKNFDVCIEIPILQGNPQNHGQERLHHLSIFIQLGRLTKLQSLTTYRPCWPTGLPPPVAVKSLDFRLETVGGLGLLSTLKALESCQFPGHQHLGEKEVDWMIEHWPRLQRVSGGLDVGDPELNRRLMSKLAAKSIRYST